MKSSSEDDDPPSSDKLPQRHCQHDDLRPCLLWSLLQMPVAGQCSMVKGICKGGEREQKIGIPYFLQPALNEERVVKLLLVQSTPGIVTGWGLWVQTRYIVTAGSQFVHTMLLPMQILCCWDSTENYGFVIRSAAYISPPQHWAHLLLFHQKPHAFQPRDTFKKYYSYFGFNQVCWYRELLMLVVVGRKLKIYPLQSFLWD